MFNIFAYDWKWICISWCSLPSLDNRPFQCKSQIDLSIAVVICTCIFNGMTSTCMKASLYTAMLTSTLGLIFLYRCYKGTVIILWAGKKNVTNMAETRSHDWVTPYLNSKVLHNPTPLSGHCSNPAICRLHDFQYYVLFILHIRSIQRVDYTSHIFSSCLSF